MMSASARRRSLWFLIFWLAVGVGSYLLGVQNEIGQRAEDTVLEAAEYTTSPPPPLNLVSEAAIAIALAVIALIALATFGWRRALAVALLPVLGIVASRLLKLQVLTRPELLELDAPNTFPSGHMTVFTVLIAALIWAVPATMRGAAALGGAALLAIVAWQLLAYGWHRPSDVLGGIALGVVIFAAASLIMPLRTERRAALGKLASLVLVMSAWLLVLAACAVVVAAFVAQGTELFLAAGQLAAIGASALACRAILLMAEPR